MLLPVLVSLAFADIAPPPGYVETCTVANHQSDATSCVTCRASFQGRESCETLEAQGYRQACRTGGASVWTEVLCAPASAAPAAPPKPAAAEPERPAADPAPPAAATETAPEGAAPPPEAAEPPPSAEPARPAGAPAPGALSEAPTSGRCSHFSATPVLLFALTLALIRRRGATRGPLDRAVRWLLPIVALGASLLPLSDVPPDDNAGGCRCAAAPAVDLAPPGGGCRCDSGSTGQ